MNGLSVCTAAGDQRTPQIISDGQFGAIIAWVDGRGPTTQIYASRVSFDGAVSTLASLMSSIVTTDAVRLEWFVGTSDRGEIGIERRAPSTDWSVISSVTPQSDGLIVMDDRDVQPGQRYGYRLLLGPAAYAGETWVSTPAGFALALDQPRPNPSSGATAVSFSLPDAATARLELFDLAGRRVHATDVGSMGAGRHVVPLLGTAHFAPGLYVVRLSQGSHAVTRRILVTR